MDNDKIRRKHILQFLETRENKVNVPPTEYEKFVYEDLSKSSKFNKEQRKKRKKRHHKGL